MAGPAGLLSDCGSSQTAATITSAFVSWSSGDDEPSVLHLMNDLRFFFPLLLKNLGCEEGLGDRDEGLEIANDVDTLTPDP